LEHCFVSHRKMSFYKDRLGTNVEETLRNKGIFCPQVCSTLMILRL
jgi:hypothetical protein